MALTMTRTRTQTALTKLAQRVAELNGELNVLTLLLAEHPEHLERLEAKKRQVDEALTALHLTIRQFDASIDPACIGSSPDWIQRYGLRRTKNLRRRYLHLLVADTTN